MLYRLWLLTAIIGITVGFATLQIFLEAEETKTRTLPLSSRIVIPFLFNH